MLSVWLWYCLKQWEPEAIPIGALAMAFDA